MVTVAGAATMGTAPRRARARSRRRAPGSTIAAAPSQMNEGTATARPLNRAARVADSLGCACLDDADAARACAPRAVVVVAAVAVGAAVPARTAPGHATSNTRRVVVMRVALVAAAASELGDPRVCCLMQCT